VPLSFKALQKFDVLKIEIDEAFENDLRNFKGHGIVSKIQRDGFKGKPCLAVQVDINIENPINNQT